MAYGEVQVTGGGTWSAYVTQDSGYMAQFEVKFSNMVGMTDQEADDFFQSIVDHLATMPGVIVQASKDRTASQAITPTPTP